MSAPAIPTATYRIQLHAGFGFREATAIVPYLAALGISHVYCSPYLKARSGSEHGYDIVDHNAINPELGSHDDFETFLVTLDDHDMSHILDLVPNHMGVGGDDNAWWLDVLENGPASRYAPYFDIDWTPIKDELRGKVLLPFLGERYGVVLENGELVLGLNTERGELSVRYHDHRFPLDPSTYPQVLGGALERISNAELRKALRAVITAFQDLPPRTTTDPETCRRRDMEAGQAKRTLAVMCATHPGLLANLHAAIERMNGHLNRADSFDGLHRLLEAQAYRLAYWHVASDEINYRRFFDINGLAGLCMDNPEVFGATHGLALALVGSGRLGGLRIDHPDGLRDPLGYYRRLRAALHHVRTSEALYIVIEKILATYEHLPSDWPVHGTTGYEFLHLVDGLFVWPDSQRLLDNIYARFIGERLDFDEVLYRCKKLVIRAQLSSELTVLANQLDKLAERDRHTRDFTLNGLREALTEVVACFPVYRTYATPETIGDQDRHFIDWAIAQVRRRNPAVDPTVFDFIRAQLLNEDHTTLTPPAFHARTQFFMRFQQYTAPVMAKAMEDTAFYRYHRLISLNEVGGDPRRYGRSPAAFHSFNRERAERWPASMLATSTHDSKRSEDVRARIDVISELPLEWRRHLGRWSRFNRSKKTQQDGLRAPSRNDEYLLYQTMVGMWPTGSVDAAGMARLRERLDAYMIKAVREAKEHSSWIAPNDDYEQALHRFIARLFERPDRNPFLVDFLAFQARLVPFGLLNGLSRTLLKLTAPGVPDIYQGNELWCFDLVDPDNRRPVDYSRRRSLLAAPPDTVPTSPRGAQVQALCEHLEDGRAKLFLTRSLLHLRRDHPTLFEEGTYVPLECSGPRAEHLIAYIRQQNERVLLVCAPRWYARLAEAVDRDAAVLTDSTVWHGTVVTLPDSLGQMRFQSLLTGHVLQPAERDQTRVLEAAMLFRHFPCAALLST